MVDTGEVMIECQDCNTQNTADSKFCKLCGHGLVSTVAVATVKPEEIDSLLNEGFQLLHESKAAEAGYLADAVLRVDPENSTALALKAMVCEQNGDIAEAIAYYEQIVIHNPDSTLDRIKLNQLRKQMDEAPGPDELEYKSRNWVAIGSGIAAAVVVIAVGIMLGLQNRPLPVTENMVASNTKGFDSPGSKQPENQTPQPNIPNPTPNPPSGTGLPNPNNPVRPNPGVFNPGPLVLTPDGSNGALPNPAGNNSSSANNPRNPTPPPDADPPDKPKPPKPAIYEISPHSGGDEGAVSENTYRIAVNKMKAGDYRGALRDFQASLSGSRNPALTHQFMARCYKALGEVSNAKQHFQIAADLYTKAGATSDAKACLRELELLGG